MGNTPGAEADSRKGSKKLKKKKSKKEKDLTLDELERLLPYLEGQLQHYQKRIDTLSQGARWEQEYGGIRDGLNAPANVSNAAVNINKNRYRNIVAYDHSRVQVQPIPDNGNSDYINANWLAGIRGPQTYIATQGPVPDAMLAFWQMVMENNCEVIVMLTNEVEGGRLKCHRYWPEAGAPVTLGSITVALTSEKPKATYVTRKFELKNGSTTMQVTQFQYTAWPDHGVPNTTAEMLSFRKVVNKEVVKGTPVVVHCSAGVGRSGTFIAIDTLIARGEQLTKELDPLGVTKDMRKNRNFMVQTLDQYRFIFRAMLDAMGKSMHRTKRAIRKRERELAGEQEQGEEQGDELDELEDEIQEATEATTGLGAPVDLVEGFKTLGRRAGARARIDAQYTAFSREDDTRVLSNVPRDVRVQSLAASAADDAWLQKGNVDTTIEGKGYKIDAVPIQSRMESLKSQADPTKWQQRYQSMAQSWSAQEDYNIGASLNPIESRMASLAQQNENSQYRSEAFRKAVEEDTRVILNSLTQRLDSLAISVAAMERARAPKGEDAALQRANEVALRDRLDALKDSSARQREVRDGRVVDNPKKKEHRELMLEKAKREEEERQREEEERLLREAEARKKKEAETAAARAADKASPTKETKKEVASSSMPMPEVQLKKTQKKEEAVHPMIAAAMQQRKSNPKLK